MALRVFQGDESLSSCRSPNGTVEAQRLLHASILTPHLQKGLEKSSLLHLRAMQIKVPLSISYPTIYICKWPILDLDRQVFWIIRINCPARWFIRTPIYIWSQASVQLLVNLSERSRSPDISCVLSVKAEKAQLTGGGVKGVAKLAS